MGSFIEMTPVKSSALAAYGIDHESQTIGVQFRNAHILHYHVPDAKVREAFDAAPSKGEFYSREIRGRYQGVMVTGDCANCGDVGLLGDACTDCGTAHYTEHQSKRKAKSA